MQARQRLITGLEQSVLAALVPDNQRFGACDPNAIPKNQNLARFISAEEWDDMTSLESTTDPSTTFFI